MRRIAFAEHAFVSMHPELEPYFHRLFGHAAEREPALAARGRHLIGWLPRRFPLLGARAWSSADLYYRQQLAPDFLAAWAEAECGARVGGAAQPDWSARSTPLRLGAPAGRSSRSRRAGAPTAST